MSAQVAEGFVVIRGRIDRATVRRVAEQISNETESVARKRSGGFWKALFTPNQAVLRTLRTGIPGILASPFGLAAITLAATFGAAFIGALASFLATAGLGSIFIAAATVGLIAMSPHIKKVAQRLVDTVKGVFRRAIQPMATPLQKSFGLIEKAAIRLEAPLTRLFTKAATAMQPLTEGLIGLVENMLPGFERSMGGINAVFRALGQHLPKLGTAIGDFFAELTKDPELLERVTGLLITWVNGFLKVAGPLLEGLMVHFGAFANFWRGFILMLKDGANPIGKLFDTSKFAGVKKGWSDFATAVRDAWRAFRDFAKANTDKEIVEKMQALGRSLKEVWDKANDLLKEVWKLAWEEIKRFWREKVEPWLKQKVSDAMDWLGRRVNEKLTQMKNSAIARVIETVQGILKWFLSLPVRVASAIASIPGRVAAKFSDARRRALDAISTLPGGVGGIFGQVASRIGSALAGVPNKVGSVLSNAAARAYNSGRQIMANLIAGILSKLSALGNTLASVASKIASYLPGSPVRTGPLMVLNQGYAGRQIIKMLATGVRAESAWFGRELGRALTLPGQPRAARADVGGMGRGPVTVSQTIYTNEIDPRVHASQLGWEIAGRLR